VYVCIPLVFTDPPLIAVVPLTVTLVNAVPAPTVPLKVASVEIVMENPPSSVFDALIIKL
jgi:hypothetical protein